MIRALAIRGLYIVTMVAVCAVFTGFTPADAAQHECLNTSYSAGRDNDRGKRKRDWLYSGKCKAGSNNNRKTSDNGDTGPAASSNSSGDWLTPGSGAYENAKKAFDLLTKTYGLSGEAAAGMLGGMQPEGNFKPDVAETGGLSGYHVKYDNQAGVPCVPSASSGGSLTFGMTNDKPVCGMAWYYKRNMLGGGGIVQFTPFTKFTSSAFWNKYGPGWDIRNQVGYIIENNVFSRSIENSCITYGGAAPAYNGSFKVEDWLGMTDPAKAEDIFYSCFLKGYKYMPERKDNAKRANAVFNAAGVKADPSKWHIKVASSSASPGAELAASSTDSNAANTAKAKGRNCNDKCKPGDAKNNQSNVAAPSTGGKHAWRHYNDLPDNMKKDAIDFTLFGMTDLKCDEHWDEPAGFAGDANMQGQCVAFSKAAAYHLWSKNGQPLKPGQCNGICLAKAFADLNGGSVSSKFSKGAIVSAISETGNPAGHTFIALQQYDDGSVLIAEQNNNMVGAAAGTACGWSYRLIPAEQTKRLNYQYYDPSTAGYTLSLDGTGSAAKAKFAGSGSSTGEALSGLISDTSAKCTVAANGGEQGGVFSSALDFAKAQVGKSYVLGTQGPDTFDCSGLAVASYKAAGFDLLSKCGRTADAQYHCVKKANTLQSDVKQCKPGDLAFFGNGDYAGHVGIIDDPQAETMVHASSPSVGVVKGKVYKSSGGQSFLGCGSPSK